MSREVQDGRGPASQAEDAAAAPVETTEDAAAAPGETTEEAAAAPVEITEEVAAAPGETTDEAAAAPGETTDEAAASPGETHALPADAEGGLPEVDVWLLDGFNVLHAVLLGGRPRGRFWERGAREQLVARLAHSSGRAGSAREIVVVFDGRRPVEGDEARPAPGIEVVFAPSADDWIVRRVRRSEVPERIGVVTQDRQVAGRAQHAGARVVAPGRFLGAFPEASIDAPTDVSAEAAVDAPGGES